jgi:aminodeoxychorismate lyase
MIIFLNGQFVPQEQALVSVLDRGFLYGDGLFETMRVVRGQPFRWQQHLERLEHGADFLRIRLPFDAGSLRTHAEQLIARNQMPESLLRLTVTRGVGPRGYSPQGAQRPTVAMSLHPASALGSQSPVRWRLITSIAFRLPAGQPLAQFKTCNKLAQIMARAEADAAQADEALLLNTDGYVVEGASSNLFWIQDNVVCTPPLASGVLAGVTRAVVQAICPQLGLAVREANIRPEELRRSQGLFLSLSSVGIAEGVSLDGEAVDQSALVTRIRTAFLNLLNGET